MFTIAYNIYINLTKNQKTQKTSNPDMLLFTQFESLAIVL